MGQHDDGVDEVGATKLLTRSIAIRTASPLCRVRIERLQRYIYYSPVLYAVTKVGTRRFAAGGGCDYMDRQMDDEPLHGADNIAIDVDGDHLLATSPPFGTNIGWVRRIVARVTHHERNCRVGPSRE